jgi:hypothetical protein
MNSKYFSAVLAIVFLMIALGANAQKQTQSLPAFPMENGKVVLLSKLVSDKYSLMR